MLFLLTMLIPSAAAIDELPFDLAQQSPDGRDDCRDKIKTTVEARYTFELTLDNRHAFEDLVVRGKGRHKECNATIGKIEVLLDGVVMWDQSFNLRSKHESTEDWHLDTGDFDVDPIARRALSGAHTLTARISGEVSEEDTALWVSFAGTHMFSRDWDGDGYVSDELSGGDDCDDDEASTHPGVPETWYDGVDADCRGGSDYDQDGDGHLHQDHGGDDCDDTAADVHPGVGEVWYDGIDGDCSGGSDYDRDHDGYDSADYGGDDCDDDSSTMHPGVDEIWYDGVDADCSGGSDYDRDGDGYDFDGTGGDDCNDGDPNIHPGAQDVWYDGLDFDCDGGDDYDQDGDGFALDVDCDDVDASAWPGSRNYDEDCVFRVLDDGSRQASQDLSLTAGGCTTTGSLALSLWWLAPILLVRRRRAG